MKYFEASFAAVVTRFYIMIGIALIAGFASIPWLGLLCVPVFLSAMLGIKFNLETSSKKASKRTLVSSKTIRTTINEAA